MGECGARGARRVWGGGACGSIASGRVGTLLRLALGQSGYGVRRAGELEGWGWRGLGALALSASYSAERNRD